MRIFLQKKWTKFLFATFVTFLISYQGQIAVAGLICEGIPSVIGVHPILGNVYVSVGGLDHIILCSIKDDVCKGVYGQLLTAFVAKKKIGLMFLSSSTQPGKSCADLPKWGAPNPESAFHYMEIAN
ncbi:MAG: hypothetical protein HQK51_21615 [Oligoflexia bacterium]|nr:hypothetical protein [Oligoflexia bacterium]